MSADELFREALKLPEGDRIALADGLLASVPAAADPEWEAAWMAEVAARADRLRSGETTADDWRVALARVRERLGRMGSP